MEPTTNISDTNCIDEMQSALNDACNNISSVMNSASEYLSSVINEMNQQKEKLKEKLDKAVKAYQEAESKYSHCLSSQKYDSESDSYRPSCNMEAARVSHYSKIKDKLEENVRKADKILSDCNEKISFFSSEGGGASMSKITGEHLDKANNKLEQIKETLSEYLTVSIPHKGGGQSRGDIKSGFEKATNRVNDLMKEGSKATVSEKARMATYALPVCPHCKRNPCECPNERGTRLQITGNNAERDEGIYHYRGARAQSSDTTTNNITNNDNQRILNILISQRQR